MCHNSTYKRHMYLLLGSDHEEYDRLIDCFDVIWYGRDRVDLTGKIRRTVNEIMKDCKYLPTMIGVEKHVTRYRLGHLELVLIYVRVLEVLWVL